MSDQNPVGDQRDEATTQIDEMRAAVADEVAALLSRLPDNAGLLEITMAEGTDPAGLAHYLADLPDTDDLATLAAAINDPEALARLLAARDSEEEQSE
jgi:hypothetical protein